MGMADNQLFADAVHHVAKLKSAFFLFDLRMENHLEQHVPQFLLESGGILLVNGLNGLMGLLQKIGADALMRLFPVPGASLGRTEQGHDLQQIIHGVAVLLFKANSHAGASQTGRRQRRFSAIVRPGNS